LISCVLAFVITALTFSSTGAQNPVTHKDLALFRRQNLVAWCIVPFDSKKRTPAERAEMLDRIGIRKVAYDYRAEHIPTFDEEMMQLKKHGIELTAWWFPTVMNDEARLILSVLKRHQIKTQLWVMGSGQPTHNEAEQRQRIEAESKRIGIIAEAAAEIGCSVGLYNHGGWFGDPKNQLAIIERLKMPNVGIVYNLHHGHDHLSRFAELLEKMKPHLYALNINGMVAGGDAAGNKIMPMGTGSLDRALIAAIQQSGYQGPIGILNHTDNDAEERLLDNLNGLDWLLDADSSSETFPKYRTWSGEPPIDEPLNSLTAAQRAAVEALVNDSTKDGQAARGVTVFASAKSACVACHKIGNIGGAVGPELTNIGKQRTATQIAESLLYPSHQIDEKYRPYQILTSDQEILRGYRVHEDDKIVTLRDPSRGTEQSVDKDDIEQMQPSPSLMPEGLIEALTSTQRNDLVAFITDLGHHERLRVEIALSVLEHAQPHAPAEFPFTRDPIDASAWPSWRAHINRDRVYDYYTKEASYFRQQDDPPHLLAEYPGMDKGAYGHWGNQSEVTWANDAWNRTILGSMQSGVFYGSDNVVVPRGFCVQLGDNQEMSVCFNPDTATYDAAWNEGFLQFSQVRFGFMNGLLQKGTAVSLPEPMKPKEPVTYQGLYRYKNRVIFAYKIGDVEYLDAPWVEAGTFVRDLQPRSQHPMRGMLEGSEPQWPQELTTEVRPGNDSPYAVDEIALPLENPWQAQMFVGDHDFLPDGSIMVCTMQGDVWQGKGVSLTDNDLANPKPSKVVWRRFASGLHQSLGLKITRDGIFVLGRDQITRLHDLNDDGEADFYECFSNAYETSTAGHDFICGLQSDQNGYFYIASGNQGLVRISPDGKEAIVIAEGFRNPDGLGIYPDRVVTIPCSEGNWTPTTMICAVRGDAVPANDETPPFYGYRGPKFVTRPVETPLLPMVYLPRGLDNSAGGQIYVDSDRWGPLKGQMLHFSYGTGSHFLVLRDEIEGTLQGAAIPLRGEFLSGAHRGRFSPIDGQLYVSGMGGWGTYTRELGSLQRVRYTGEKVQLPIGIRAHENGVAIMFPHELDESVAAKPRLHFAQAWNYRYSGAYGSAEYSASRYGARGHDLVEIKSVHRLDDGKTLFLEMPELQPVNQLHLQINVGSGQPVDVFSTCHRFDKPRTDIAGYVASEKVWNKHPIEIDVAMAARKVPNPWQVKIDGARNVKIVAGKNLTYETQSFTAKRGETLALTFVNPDVVPHNWALVKQGKLEVVGEEANRLVADPEALIRQYAPQTDDVICYTDIVEPGQKFAIYFKVPDLPGHYPYLCTFPGHWMVMNGEMIVE